MSAPALCKPASWWFLPASLGLAVAAVLLAIFLGVLDIPVVDTLATLQGGWVIAVARCIAVEAADDRIVPPGALVDWRRPRNGTPQAAVSFSMP